MLAKLADQWSIPFKRKTIGKSWWYNREALSSQKAKKDQMMV